jgi:hypothetical protein
MYVNFSHWDQIYYEFLDKYLIFWQQLKKNIEKSNIIFISKIIMIIFKIMKLLIIFDKIQII